MGKELDFLVAHYRIVGDPNNVIQASVDLKKNILDASSFLSLKTALSETTGAFNCAKRRLATANDFSHGRNSDAGGIARCPRLLSVCFCLRCKFPPQPRL